ETDVGMPAHAFAANAQDEVAAGTRNAGSPHAHAGEQQVDLGAERLERGLQQQVLLEAVATATFLDDLALEVLQCERHRQAALRVEGLERDGGRVRAVHRRQARAPAETDSLEVGVEVEHAGSVGWAATKGAATSRRSLSIMYRTVCGACCATLSGLSTASLFRRARSGVGQPPIGPSVAR